jgi:hypothetical protein
LTRAPGLRILRLNLSIGGEPVRKLTCASVVLLGLLIWGGSASAVTLNYPKFNNARGLSLNDEAALTGAGEGNRLRLVSADEGTRGSAFTKRKVLKSGKSFKTQFRFDMHDTASFPADGLAFVLQSEGKTVVGDGGGGLGYGSIARSVAVEFDIFDNPENVDPDGNHFAIHLAGNAGEFAAVKTPAFSLYDGVRWVWISYSAKSKRL